MSRRRHNSGSSELHQQFAVLLQCAASALPGLAASLTVGDAAEFPDDRDHAYCKVIPERGRYAIVVAPKILHAEPERQLAVLAHELGHAALLFMGVPNHKEKHADEMARALFGHTVKYDSDLVQTWGHKARYARRPSFLPQ